jgi:hypothetical protein
MEEDPVKDSLGSRKALTKWLWRIHNKVNDKLREQGLAQAQEPNPPFDTEGRKRLGEADLYTEGRKRLGEADLYTVKKVYEERVDQGCIKTEFEGWDFLFSIAENHPFSPSSKNSLPMEGCPSLEENLCLKEKNHWNLLKPEERYKKFEEFWLTLGSVLPFQEWIDAWTSAELNKENLINRSACIKELWRIRCSMEKSLDLVNKEKFRSLCKRIRENRSGCGKKPRARTCRRSRGSRSRSRSKSAMTYKIHKA